MPSERPKSSFTEASPEVLGREPDSEEDLPRYSHLEVRAKPCWGRPVVGCEAGGGPKT